MLQRSPSFLCMSVPVACRTLGFRAPPKDKKTLKKRFVALTKEHHPDQNTSTGTDSTQKMIDVTEAYKTLKKLLDNDGGLHARDMHSAVAAMQRRRAEGGATGDPTMEDVAASFVAPGVSLSMHGFTLPWQRAATVRQSAKKVADLEKARDAGFGEYVSAVRAVEKERVHREEARRRDAPFSEGSHGFTAAYFESLHAAQAYFRERRGAATRGGNDSTDKDKGADAGLGKPQSTAVLPLALRFYGRRLMTSLRQGPRRTWDALRYIVFGH